ncbi:LysR family transcriptional regulator [Pseudomonas typographi]|uniref:LysR family transcriptional regulator n=1 Tax=Pseudomonas typographi TaxID=2715964 RepID=UPI00168673ED|nr:LysR family transcriptional regulator [Pseudomonas typographi]MBD1589618.1 LysR family transcriptional regulator [Pseudomonas typographi]
MKLNLENPRRLPSLSALRAFEAASRCRTLTEAAQALCVTVGAVSRQIRQLEDDLGVSLFHRTANGVTLNETGQRLARDVSKAFSMLLMATQAVRPQAGASIVLTCTISITSHWLSKRLPGITASAAGAIALTIDPSSEVRDLDHGDADLAIRYNPRERPLAHSALLLEDMFFPVCSPAYLSSLGTVREPLELVGARLVQSPWYHQDRLGNATWDDWFAAVAGCHTHTTPALSFSGVGYAMHEVTHNGGVIIGSSALLHDELADGRLVPVFGSRHRLTSPYEYRLVWTQSAQQSRAQQQLINGLLWAAGQPPVFPTATHTPG